MELKKETRKKGMLIVIEGIDSSGKETQANLLYESMKKEGMKVRKVEFPDYKSDSSSLIKMYLRGDFGKDPERVNPYAASIFFAADRFASYNSDWRSDYENGGIIICDRYITSNMIYQAAKFDNYKDREGFLDWLADLEFKKLKLPPPDIVIFLNISPIQCSHLLKNRANKITGEHKKDIHESDKEYLEKTYETALLVAKKYKWGVIDCLEKEALMSVEEINNLIKTQITGILKKAGFRAGKGNGAC